MALVRDSSSHNQTERVISRSPPSSRVSYVVSRLPASSSVVGAQTTTKLNNNEDTDNTMLAKMAAVIMLAIAALYVSRCKAFMFESPMSWCHIINQFNLASSAITSTSATSYLPQFKRRRKATNSLTINFAAAREVEQKEVLNEEGDDEDHRTISSTYSNNPILHRTNRNEKLFQKRLKELQDFRFNHGHGSIPSPYPSNPSLGIWAANIRQQYSLWKLAEERGSPYIGYLTQSRKQQLQLAGFDFASLTERQFRIRLKELEIFKEKYGHCMVPEKWDENVALGAWVSNLRTLYKKRMMKQQQRQLQLQHAGEKVKDNNDVAESKNGNQSTQRRNRRILLKSSSHHLRKKRQRLPRFSHLDENRIQVLEEMGFVWSSIDRKWFEMLEWAKVYGVVNHAMKSHGAEDVGGDVDPAVANNTIPADWKYSAQSIRIHENYLQFVQNIQNQSLLPRFHPQDRILELLSEETFAQSNFKEPPQWQPTSSLPQTDALDVSISSSLDYRIRRNDALHQPLRIWMINQRSNYNRLDHSTNHQTRDELSLTSSASTLSAQRQQALEAIYFPWSGRFRSRVEELQHEQEVLESMKRKRARERRMKQKVRNEQEQVERLTSSIVASISFGDKNGSIELAETDIMTLWGEEEDVDDDDYDDGW